MRHLIIPESPTRRNLGSISLAAILLLVGLLMLVLVQPVSGASTKKPPIVLGMFTPLSGSSSATGIPAANGVQTWVAQTNAKGGINGHLIKLITLDDAGIPSQAVSDVQRLISVNHVMAIICGSTSGDTQAVLPLINETKTPFLSCISSDPALLTPFSKYVYSVYANENDQAQGIATYIGSKIQSTRPAIIYNNSDYGVAGFDATTAALKAKYNLSFVDAQEYNTGAVDFTSELLNIEQSNPDSLLIQAYPAEVGIIVRQAEQLGMNVPFIGGGATPTSLLPAAAGSASVGLKAIWVFPTLPVPSNSAVRNYIGLLKKYVDQSGIPSGRPSLYDMTGYCAGTIMGEALSNAGVTPTQGSLLSALNKIKNFTPGNGMCFPVSYTDSNHSGSSATTFVTINKSLNFAMDNAAAYSAVVSRITGVAVPGRRVVMRVLGSNFSGNPEITSNAAGTTVRLAKTSSRVLTLLVTSRAGTGKGVHLLTIGFATGQVLKIRYNVR